MAERGHKVHIFCPGLHEYESTPHKNIYFHSLPGLKLKNGTGFQLSVPIHRYFNNNYDFLDICHNHTHYTVGAIGIITAKKFGIPIIGTHSSPFHYYSAQYIPIIGLVLVHSKFLWQFERWILDIYDFVHVPTRSKKNLLLSYKFREPIIYMSNGIPDFYYREIKENGIKEKYSLENKRILLYVSRLSPEKHTIKVIKCFKNINKRIPDAQLVIVGSDGPLTSHVKNIVKKEKYKDKVSYLGTVPYGDILKLYHAADLSCLWSWVEAEGLVLLEAMAQGTPNVGANACGIEDVILHGKTGYLANNLKQFEKYVIELLQNEDLRLRFGKNAKDRALSYRISEIAKTWESLYRFTIEDFHKYKSNSIPRMKRVELLKQFVKKIPNCNF
jgi:glycosyltransferase involved in cell wall biosynthesis